jgi:hypothetical protein
LGWVPRENEEWERRREWLKNVLEKEESNGARTGDTVLSEETEAQSLSMVEGRII